MQQDRSLGETDPLCPLEWDNFTGSFLLIFIHGTADILSLPDCLKQRAMSRNRGSQRLESNTRGSSFPPSIYCICHVSKQPRSITVWLTFQPQR